MAIGSRRVEKKILSLLHGRKTRTQLTEIHGHLLRHHLHQSNQILSHFVSVCGSQGKMSYADLIFHKTHNPSILLFNSMIKGYSLCKPFESSVVLFLNMKRRGIWPDEFTFAPLLKASVNLCDQRLGEGIHGGVLVLGFGRFFSIRIGIVELYACAERMEEAKMVFDEMPQKDVIAWNLMIRGFCKSGQVGMGYQLFRQMTERSTVTWNIMISSLGQIGRDTAALELFCEMRDNDGELDEATLVTMLPICARLGEVEVGQWIHSYAKSSGLYRDFVSVGNSLVDFYCKSGNLEIASLVFENIVRKNVVSWNSMISGLAFNGKNERGISLFEEMMNEGVTPNDSTFVGVLTCCAHAGLVQKGRDLFDSMTTNHQIGPRLEHYGCMIDLLGRNGNLREAYNLIQTMPVKPNAAVLGALLSACRTHGDTELAEFAVSELINLEPWNSGNYVLLSNINSERGRWDEVEKVRLLMKEKNICKTPGHSKIG